MLYTSLIDQIGHTPMLRLTRIEQHFSLPFALYAKLEMCNPGGSVKDRVGLSMITDAEQRGWLQPGATIIEPTSGNTGIGLAWIARLKGYQTIIVMPDSMSVERRRLLEAYGAHLVLTPGAEGMAGAVQKAEELRNSIPGSVLMGQFSNPANPAAHIQTAEEILSDMQGQVDAFFSGVGSGGTVSGVGQRLKQTLPHVQIVAVEPASSPVLKGHPAGAHKIQGIGANFIPDNYDPQVVDDVLEVTDADAMEAMKWLATYESVLAGISSGAALSAAIQWGKHHPQAHNLVVLLPDSGERYLA